MEKNWILVRPGKRPVPDNREKAISRDVSPCSEYTRFTAEGRMKDPHSDLSVVLDRVSIGPLFLSGPFNRPKWSSKLGYGMANIEDDTRVHLHANGKYIIRRALDQEHALASYSVLTSIARPAVFSSIHDAYLWEMIRDIHTGEGTNSPDIIDLVTWPDEREDDPGKVIEDALSAFSAINDRFGQIIESLDDPRYPDSILGIEDNGGRMVDTFRSNLQDILEGERNNTGSLLGSGAFICVMANHIENIV